MNMLNGGIILALMSVPDHRVDRRGRPEGRAGLVPRGRRSRWARRAGSSSTASCCRRRRTACWPRCCSAWAGRWARRWPC
ncbi:MAG: hypothetical protein M0C28_23200 [Candidatus Moduliflexus flocculans]|nr:hypothetical protein [Candidatus Moduliflexus flocculans]